MMLFEGGNWETSIIETQQSPQSIHHKAHILAHILTLAYISNMSQMTIYLDLDTEKMVRAAARQENKSLSRWAGEQLAKAAGVGQWPKNYFELFGSIDDNSFQAPTDIPESLDSTRETL